MTLQFQLMPINFTGMDTKQDDKLLVPGKLALLQNMWMDKTGTIKKRFGYASVSMNSSYSYALAEFAGYPTTFATDVSAVKGAISKITSTNFVCSLTISQSLAVVPPDSNNQFGYSLGSGAVSLLCNGAVGIGGTYYYVYMILIDNSTLGQLTPRTLFLSNVISAFCCFNWSSPGFVYCARSGAAGGDGLRLALVSGTTLPSSSVLLDLNGTNGTLCKAYQFNNILYVVYHVGATPTKLYVCSYDLSADAVVRITSVSDTLLVHADVSVDASGCYVAYWDSNGGNAKATVKRYTLDLGTLTSTSVTSAIAGATANDLGRIHVIANTAKFGCFYTQVYATLNVAETRYWDGTITYYAGNVSIIAKPFLISRAGVSLPATFVLANGTEGSAVMITPTNNIQVPGYLTPLDEFGGFFFGRIRGALSITTGLTEKYLNDPLTQSENFSPVCVWNELSFTNIEGGSSSTGRKESNMSARFAKFETLTAPAPTLAGIATEIASNAQGDVKFFDGFYSAKSGFFSRPLPLTISSAGSGAGLGAGTYLYCWIYEYTDNRGNLFRSAPSDVRSVTLGAGPSTVTCQVGFIDNANYFARIGATVGTVPVKSALYRTLAGGSVFYRVTTVGAPAMYYVDAIPDATLVGSTPLYTTGGILENIPAPGARSLAVGKNRVFVCASERDELWFSKKLVAGEIPAFNEALSIALDSQGGQAISPMEMDDKILILKRSAIQVIYGDGPDETGAGPFQGPQIVSTEQGVVSANAAVLTDDGVMFKGDRGIYLCDRGLQVRYVGKEVADYNANTVVAAYNLRDRDHTYFWTAEGNTLVYDSFHRIWSVYTGQICQSASLINGVPYYIQTKTGIANAAVLKEDQTVFGENGTAIPIVVKTGWMSLAGIQGFQRIRKLLFLGKSYAAHTVTAKLYYDFNATEFETISVSSATIMPVGDSVYQYVIRPKRQKCEAFRFELSVSDTTQAFELSNFALEIGIKPKSNRMPMYKRVSS